jgi:hypothetical protein
MAIRDAQLQFCAAQALPNGTAADSTNVIDLAIAKGLNTNKPLILYLLWSGTPIGTSVRIDLRSGATTSMTSSPRIHWSTGIIPAASYASQGIGSGLEPMLIALPHSYYNPSLSAGTSATAPYLQYLGLHFITVGDASAGVVTAGLVEAMDMRTYAASGYTAPSI